jgi:two-component system NtrC family sensor kinase
MASRPLEEFIGIGFSKVGHFKEVRTKIYELEALNRELAQRSNKLEAVFNSMNEGLTILDRDLTIVEANEVQRRRYPDFPLIGRKCYDVFRRKTKACRDCPALKTMATGETLSGETLQKEGEFHGRHYEWTTSAIKDSSGEVREVMLLTRDITDRKDYEFKLMQADRMAAVGFLAAGIAHEINNPLTSIAGFSEGLLKRMEKIPELGQDERLTPFREYLEIIVSEVYRCKNFIRNLVEFSRKSTTEFEPIAIDKMVNSTVALVRKQAKDNDINLLVDNSLSEGLNKIAGNEPQLRHLLLHIINRACMQMSEGGDLHIITRNKINRVEVLITNHKSSAHSLEHRDAGDADALHRQQEDESLSMAVCRNIVARHKGVMDFKRSEEGALAYLFRFPTNLP